MTMDNSRTQYACGICEKDFFNPNSLVKHVELRHPLSARQSSTCSNKNKGTPKTNLQWSPREFNENKIE